MAADHAALSVLLVEDDETTRRLHNAVLLGAGFVTRMAGTIAELKQEIGLRRFDIILLDLVLPDGNALDIVPELRETTSAGIIIATASNATDDRLSGLERGADEYLEKPVHPREIIIRITNLAARLAAARSSASDLVHHFEGWTADLAARKVTFHDGSAIPLTENEFRLLDALIRQGIRPLHRDRLLALLDDEGEATARAVDRAIYRMRIKFHAVLGHGAPFIETVRGFGYRLAVKQL